MLDRATDREISLPQQVCPLALLNSIWGYRINLGKHASPSFSLLFLTPPDEDSVCSQLLCHMSQLRQKCLLGFFSQYFSPVTRFAPGRYTNPINRKPIAPPGQIKTPPPLFPLLSHTPSVTLQRGFSPSVYADMFNKHHWRKQQLDQWCKGEWECGGVEGRTVRCLVRTKNIHQRKAWMFAWLTQQKF